MIKLIDCKWTQEKGLLEAASKLDFNKLNSRKPSTVLLHFALADSLCLGEFFRILLLHQ
jgi:hypothetical protein